MKLKEKKYQIILFSLILLQTINIVFWGIQKEGYHIDEVFSYGLSNSYYDPFPYYYNEDSYFMNWHDSQYFKDYVMVSEEHRFSYDSVVYNQSQDVHPPLYYMILHTICSFFPATFSNWYGLSINIVFTVLNIILLNSISCFVFKEKKELGLLVSAAYGFSAGCISNAVYIRMYVMMTFFVLLYTFLHVKLYAIQKYRILLPILSLVTIGGSLTQYYFYIFAFFISAFYCLHLLFIKKWKVILSYVIAILGGIGISILLYPYALNHIFQGYRGTEAVDNLMSDNLSEKLSAYLSYINLELFGGYLKYFILITVVLVISVAMKKNIILKKIQKKGIFIEYQLQGEYAIEKVEYVNISIIVTTLVYAFLVAKMSTISANRYIFPVYPFLVLYFTLFMYNLIKKIISNNRVILIIASLVWAVIILTQYKQGYIDYLYKGYSLTQQEVAQYSQSDVLYIGDYEFPIYRDMMFLAKAERFIPIKVFELEESLQKIKEEVRGEDILIYVYKEHYDDDVLNIITKELGYIQFDFIAETYQSRVYYGHK